MQKCYCLVKFKLLESVTKSVTFLNETKNTENVTLLNN